MEIGVEFDWFKISEYKRIGFTGVRLLKWFHFSNFEK